MNNQLLILIDIAREATDRHPARHRNTSTITFSVSKKTYDDIKAELIACRKRILSMVELSEKRFYYGHDAKTAKRIRQPKQKTQVPIQAD